MSNHTELLPGHYSDVVDEECRGYGFCVTLLDANSPVCLGGSIMVVVYLITLAGNCWMTVKLVC